MNELLTALADSGWVTLPNLVVLTTAIAVLLRTRLERRKLGADAAATIATAATTLVTPLQTQVNSLQEQVNSLRSAILTHDHLVAKHNTWDEWVEQAMTDAGIEFPQRPPLRDSDAPYNLHEPACITHGPVGRRH